MAGPLANRAEETERVRRLQDKEAPRYDRQAYMKFDVSDLDVSSTGSAKLRVFGRVVGGGVADRNLALGLFDAPGAKWGERGITYDTRPDTSAAVVAAAVVNKDENQWWEFDVTSWLRAQRAAGRSILTLALRNLDASSAFTVLHSRQGSFNGPQLVLTA